MRRAVMALVGVMVLALTGCSWSQASVAAQVGDTTISVSTVNQLAKGIAEVFAKHGVPFEPKVVPKVAMQGLLVGTLLNQASDKGESIFPASEITKITHPDPTTTDPAQLPQAQATAALVLDVLALPGGADWVRGELTLGQIQNSQDVAAALMQITKSVTVTVNPRFGSWDQATGWFSAESGSLSTTAPPQSQS